MSIFVSIIASMVLLLGIASMLTPIPGGTLMIAGSLTALICSSPTARKTLKHGRSRISLLNRFFYFMERTVGAKINLVGSALVQTRPDMDSK